MVEFKGTKGDWFWQYFNYYPTEGTPPNQYDKLLISKAPKILELLKYFTAFPDEDFEEEMNQHVSFTMTVDARKIKEAKQLIKEATKI